MEFALDPILNSASWNSLGIPIRTFATWNSNSGSQNLLQGSNLLNPCLKYPTNPTPYIQIRIFSTWNSKSGSQNQVQGSNLLNPCLKYPTPPQAFSGLLALTFSPAENAPPWIFGTGYFSNWSELIRIGKSFSELIRICKILEPFASSWSPNFPIQFSEIRSPALLVKHSPGDVFQIEYDRMKPNLYVLHTLHTL